jgi:hypothetical protein
MRDVPLDALRPCCLHRHPIQSVPLPVQRHAPFAFYIPLTMFSVIFLASPSNIMVLSR